MINFNILNKMNNMNNKFREMSNKEIEKMLLEELSQDLKAIGEIGHAKHKQKGKEFMSRLRRGELSHQQIKNEIGDR